MADRALTDVELERWLADDLAEGRMKLATAADRTRLEELRAEHAAFLGTVDVGAEVRAIEKRIARTAPEPRKLATWWKWVASGGALAAAAAVLLVVTRRTEPPAGDDDLQAKGDTVGLVIHVATGSDSRRVATGDTVQPGDRIRFEVSVPRRGFVAVVGIDGAGASNIYYPFGGREPAAIDPRAGGGLLPGAIQLDATPGDERFYVVYSERPFPVGDQLFAGLRGGSPPHGVSTTEVVLHKK